jgi:hypothetical protein
MMVADSPYVANQSQLLKDLTQLNNKLEKINDRTQEISTEELNDLFQNIDYFNGILNEEFWSDKKLLPEKANATIEKALKAIFLFQNIRPENNLTGQRNVDAAIASFSSAWHAAVSKLDKNLRDLKKYKIGRRVEKVSKSKES